MNDHIVNVVDFKIPDEPTPRFVGRLKSMNNSRRFLPADGPRQGKGVVPDGSATHDDG